MDTNPMIGNLLFQAFAAILIAFTVIAAALSRQAKLVKVRVRRYTRNTKIENSEE